MASALEGIRIVDLTTMLSGPWATMILGDQGADVVKVEEPGKGDHVRSLGNQRGGMSSMFLNINRNKRSITLDLKSRQGIAVLKDLVLTADVLVQNFRPGVVQRLGIGPEELRARDPRLIYVSLSGFGDKGPWAHKRVYDPVVQALSGLTTIQAGSDAERPRLIRTVLPDKLTAVTAAQAIAAALFARTRTGAGQHIKLSMLDGVLAFLWASDMGAQTYVDSPVSNQAAASFIDLIYQTADGFMTVSVMSNAEWAGLCRAFGKPEWLADPRFATPAARDQHVNERLELTQEVLRTRTTREWLERLEQEDVPCAPALTRNEVVSHPQVAANESLVVYPHPTAGPLRQARPAALFEATPSAIRRGAPRLGEHTDEILREVGYSAERISELRRGGVLTGKEG
jgi:crotonobetainyl-CoA:carnitine CoA-transferase CaiB-like acyl-CoA transferase